MSSGPTISSQDVLVRWQPTPNPFAMKFIVNYPLKSEGKATFSSPSECDNLPLASSLLQIPGVKQLHFFQNTVTVTHDGSLTEDELTAQTESVLRTRLPIHDPGFAFGETPQPNLRASNKAGSSPEIQKIEEILDRTIRPGLQADGGDIEVLSFENDELRILYQGACGGCPSSMMGTLDAIQGILQQELGNDKLIVIPS